MHEQAHLFEAELNAGFEAVVAFTEACRFVSDDALKAPALALSADAEGLLRAATERLGGRDPGPVQPAESRTG
jgi:hypothetical protein